MNNHGRHVKDYFLLVWNAAQPADIAALGGRECRADALPVLRHEDRMDMDRRQATGHARDPRGAAVLHEQRQIEPVAAV
jgi:hypothetical protein